jgi:hypothetical protein
MKTKYRIIPKETYIADFYLQFLDESSKKPKWRYIPEKNYGYVIGDILQQKDCPTKLVNFEGFAIRGFGNERLKEFVNLYPNIEDYFILLRNMRESYILRKKSKKDRQIEYL